MPLPTPCVRHYRAARDWQQFGGSTYARDEHVLSQLLGVKVAEVERADARHVTPLMAELGDAVIPVRRRVVKGGPVDSLFVLLDCPCCPSCVVVCDCQNVECGCEDEPREVAAIRQPTAGDVRKSYSRTIDGTPYLDDIALVERVTTLLDSSLFDDLPWAQYLPLDMAVGRAAGSPLAFWQTSPPSWCATP